MTWCEQDSVLVSKSIVKDIQDVALKRNTQLHDQAPLSAEPLLRILHTFPSAASKP